MTWYADLAPCDYFGSDATDVLRAVGWLERGKVFPTGDVAEAVFHRLLELSRDPWEPLVSCGPHECDLCQFHQGPSGSRNVFIPAVDRILVCPTLITHYISAHGYRPPDEFCLAVVNCPNMRSMAYKRRLLASGGGALLNRMPRPNR